VLGAGTGTTVVSFFSQALRPSAIKTTAAETASFGLVMTPPVQNTNTFSLRLRLCRVRSKDSPLRTTEDSDQSDDDQIQRDDEIEQPRNDQNQNTGDQRYQWSDR
jgi:hypothetical protein